MPDVGSVKRLVTVIQDLSAVRSLDEIMTLVRSAAREIANADGATFVLRDNGFCYYADEDAISPLWKGQKFPMDSCISGWAMTHKQTVIIPDIYSDSRIPIEAYRPTFVKSLAMIPIRQESPLGAIGVYWAKETTATPEQIELLQALADTVAVAMENISLYSSLEQRIGELKKANEAKDEFLMTVSHELRTPLNAILGWSEILTTEEPDVSEERKGLETIRRNAYSQAHIIDDLLDTSRIMVGRLTLDPHEVDLVMTAQEAVQEVSFDAHKRNINVQLSSSMSEALIKADPVRLKQIFFNLLTNAIKFSPSGSDIFVKISRSGPGVQVQIEDHGMGITPDFIGHVFDRFKQADSSLTRKHGALGLGLAITKYLVEAHGEHIEVKSDGDGKGAVFTFTIPLVETQKERISDVLTQYAQNPNKASHRLAGMKILVVDDDDDSRALVETILKKHGAFVEKANSVHEALVMARAATYDLVVSDLSMPEEDGFSLARKVRAGSTPFQRQVPMIALTAFTDKENERKAIGNGFNSFFGKPFSTPKLIDSVENLVGVH